MYSPTAEPSAMSTTVSPTAEPSAMPTTASPTADPTAVPTAPPTEVGLIAGNDCASGYTKVTTEIECRVALRLGGYLGEDFQGSESDASWPSGCYQCQGVAECGNGIWFNSHATGASNGAAKSLCVSTTNGFTQNNMVFDGDSDIDYMPAEWATLYPASYNVGVGGDTCADVVNRAADIISVLKPSKITIICGENDLASGSSVETAFSIFTAAVELYNAAGVEVIYIGTKPEPDTTSLHNDYRQYDTKIKAYTTNRQLTMIDLYNSFEDLGNPSTLYISDNLHMSELGYSHVASWLNIELADTSGCDVWRSGVCTQDDLMSFFPSADPTSFPTATASPSTAPASFLLPLLMLLLPLIYARF